MTHPDLRGRELHPIYSWEDLQSYVAKLWTWGGEELEAMLKIHKTYFFFNFIFKLYITVLVLPNIKMNPPQV